LSSASQPRSNGSSRWRAFGALWVLALLLASGCGFGEYEDKVKAEKERIDQFDDDNNNLADAADLSQSTPLFFRPPRNMSRTPSRDRDLYIFGPQKGGNFEAVYMAYTTDPKEDLESKVWNQLRIPKTKLTREQVGPDSHHKPLTVDRAVTRTRDAIYYFYAYRQNPWLVIVVYKIHFEDPKRDDTNLKAAMKLMDASMATLAVGDPLGKKKREAFRPRA
jgi:hypothetical protein